LQLESTFDCSKVIQLFRMGDGICNGNTSWLRSDCSLRPPNRINEKTRADSEQSWARGMEAVAYAAQSDTVLLKRPVRHSSKRKESGSAADPTAETT
jgi:hypothetical protein